MNSKIRAINIEFDTEPKVIVNCDANSIHIRAVKKSVRQTNSSN